MTEEVIGVLLLEDSYKVKYPSAQTLLSINPEFKLLGEYSSGKELLVACAELLPDVVLVHNPDDMSQFEFVEIFIKQYPKIGLAVARGTWGEAEMGEMMLKGVPTMFHSPYGDEDFYNTIRYAKNNPPPNYKLRGSILG